MTKRRRSRSTTNLKREEQIRTLVEQNAHLSEAELLERGRRWRAWRKKCRAADWDTSLKWVFVHKNGARFEPWQYLGEEACFAWELHDRADTTPAPF